MAGEGRHRTLPVSLAMLMTNAVAKGLCRAIVAMNLAAHHAQKPL